MSLEYLPPGCKNTRETLPPSKWELASNDRKDETPMWTDDIKRVGLFVCMHVGGEAEKESRGSQT